MTGLDTWLWAVTPAGASINTTIRGYPVTCSVSPVGWTWESGDGSTYRRDHAGAPHPMESVTHLYETKGDYDLTLRVDWRLETNYGSATLPVTHTERYHVFEVRAVLTSSG